MKKPRLSVKTASFRFIVFLLLLATLAAGNYMMAEQRIEATKFISDVMENIGQQRMNSQRIALLSKSMVESNYSSARKTFRTELLALVDKLEKEHADLLHGSLSKKLPREALQKVQSVYLEKPFYLERDMKRFISSAKLLAKAPDASLSSDNPHFFYISSLAQSNRLVSAQNKVVRYYEEESDKIINRNILLGRLQLGLFLFVLALLVGLVFLPMAKRMRKEMEELEKINKSMSEQSENVSNINKKLKDKESALMDIMEDLAVKKKNLQTEIDERKKAEEKLNRVNKELNDFAYVVSHDLKAPLRGVGSLAGWIASDYADKLDENGKESLALLTGRVKRMNDLIDGLLKLAKVGRTEGESMEINLNSLMAEIVDFINPPKSISFTITPHLPTLYYDKTRIQQVFQNLLSNAVKYMDKPNGEIRVDQQDKGSFWEFSVNDNGPGIEKKHFDKVFQIFQTLVPKDTADSTGIGLSLVKKIVETYGGKVWVESEVGVGSTFFFTLPKTKEPANKGEVRSETKAA